MVNKVLFSRNSTNWGTPEALYNELNKEFKFDFDPCPLNHDLKRFDGLNTCWDESNFVNPPYDNINAWVIKAYEEYIKGKTIVLLLPSRTDTIWFHKFLYEIAEIRFIKGRLKFNNSKNSAPFPSMICILRGFKKNNINNFFVGICPQKHNNCDLINLEYRKYLYCYTCNKKYFENDYQNVNNNDYQ